MNTGLNVNPLNHKAELESAYKGIEVCLSDGTMHLIVAILTPLRCGDDSLPPRSVMKYSLL